MNKQTQDLLFACLPKEAREEVKMAFNMPSKCGYSDSVRLLLTYIFGSHNLTSDTEPEEMLMVEKKTIMNIYEANERIINGSQWPEDFRSQAVHVNSLFETLFGDKCLPYTKPETKDMEEKELNLAELLKGCDERAFYSPTFSVVLLKAINEDDNKPLFWDFGVMTSYTYADGRIYSDSVPTIFPSRALYEKYPLDAYSAWMEWKESRKPKRWRAEKGEIYWFFDRTYTPYQQEENGDIEDEIMYDAYNYFRTKEEAQQAAEAVRECLEKIYEKNKERPR